MASRKLDDLLPSTKAKAQQFAIRMAEEGIPFVFTCTYRSSAEQKVLYMQGREPLDIVNAERKKLGLYLLPKDENRIVTKVLVSVHQARIAFDIAIVLGKKALWNLKADVNMDQVPDYIQAGQIGQSLGLRWGGDWNGNGSISDERWLDFPHFEEVLNET